MQLLIDFLGSAERETPLRGRSVVNAGAVSDDDDSNCGQSVMMNQEDTPADEDDVAKRTFSAPLAFLSKIVREMHTRHQPQNTGSPQDPCC